MEYYQRDTLSLFVLLLWNSYIIKNQINGSRMCNEVHVYICTMCVCVCVTCLHLVKRNRILERCYASTVIPMFLAVPSTIFMAASISVQLRSGSLVVAISLS